MTATKTATKTAQPRARRTPKDAGPVLHAAYTTRSGAAFGPSTLPAALTGFVRDAVAAANAAGMPWNDTARFVGHVRLTVGTYTPYTPGLAQKLLAEADRDDFRCGGQYGNSSTMNHRSLGVATLRLFAGRTYSADTMYDADLVDAVKQMVASLAAPAPRRVNGMARSADWK